MLLVDPVQQLRWLRISGQMVVRISISRYPRAVNQQFAVNLAHTARSMEVPAAEVANRQALHNTAQGCVSTLSTFQPVPWDSHIRANVVTVKDAKTIATDIQVDAEGIGDREVNIWHICAVQLGCLGYKIIPIVVSPVVILLQGSPPVITGNVNHVHRVKAVSYTHLTLPTTPYV